MNLELKELELDWKVMVYNFKVHSLLSTIWRDNTFGLPLQPYIWSPKNHIRIQMDKNIPPRDNNKKLHIFALTTYTGPSNWKLSWLKYMWKKLWTAIPLKNKISDWNTCEKFSAAIPLKNKISKPNRISICNNLRGRQSKVFTLL